MKGLFSDLLKDDKSIPVVTAYYYKQWSNYEMLDHTHRSMEIMYVIAGNCTVEIGEAGVDRNSINMKKGEFIFLNGTVPHRLIVETSCRMLNVEFGFAESKAVLPSMEELAEAEPTLAVLFECSHFYLLLREPNNVYHTLKNLVIELDNLNKRATMVQLLLAELLLRIAELYHKSEFEHEQGREYYVQKAIEYLYENYDQDLRVADVAKNVSLHPAYLQKIFKQVTGKSVLEYLNIHRIEKTKMFLSQTDIPIMDIVDYVGVGSRQYLHYIFKKHTGMTPITYRQSVESERYFTE